MPLNREPSSPERDVNPPSGGSQLLHLAQAAAAAGEWAEVETIVEHEQMLTSADADFIAACSPSVVVALIERLTAAEAALAASQAWMAHEDISPAIADVRAWNDTDEELYNAMNEAITVWRGVSGLQEPTKADEQ